MGSDLMCSIKSLQESYEFFMFIITICITCLLSFYFPTDMAPPLCWYQQYRLLTQP